MNERDVFRNKHEKNNFAKKHEKIVKQPPDFDRFCSVSSTHRDQQTLGAGPLHRDGLQQRSGASLGCLFCRARVHSEGLCEAFAGEVTLNFGKLYLL